MIVADKSENIFSPACTTVCFPAVTYSWTQLLFLLFLFEPFWYLFLREEEGGGCVEHSVVTLIRNRETCSSAMIMPAITSICADGLLVAMTFLLQHFLSNLTFISCSSGLKDKWRTFWNLRSQQQTDSVMEQWNWLFCDVQFFWVPMPECIMMTRKETEDTQNTFCKVACFGWATVWLAQCFTALYCHMTWNKLLNQLKLATI